jgi:hypothetical protein
MGWASVLIFCYDEDRMSLSVGNVEGHAGRGEEERKKAPTEVADAIRADDAEPSQN